MSDPQVVVIRDLNGHNDEPVECYIDAERVAFKSFEWWSDDNNDDTILSNYYRCPEGSDGPSGPCEYRLPDRWTAEEWAAILAHKTDGLPTLTASFKQDPPETPHLTMGEDDLIFGKFDPDLAVEDEGFDCFFSVHLEPDGFRFEVQGTVVRIDAQDARSLAHTLLEWADWADGRGRRGPHE